MSLRGRLRALPLPACALAFVLSGVLAFVLAVALPCAAPAGAAPADEETAYSSPAVDGSEPPPTPPSGHPWFGPQLDVDDGDLPEDYADRLGATPSLYTLPVDYPLDGDDVDHLERHVREIATQGAVVVLDVEPTESLTGLDEGDAEVLSDRLAALHEELDSFFLVRFAPEMNGTWTTWGQQPEEFRRAYRQVAAAVHAATEHAAMVWAPAYGSGYPFGRSYGRVDPSGDRAGALLDTSGDGRVTAADDPYGPYWPGDDAVDWVGLSLYRFGQAQGVEENAVPEPAEFADRLGETWGYGDPAATEPFYDRFAAGRSLPMIVQTSALWNPAVEGDDERDLKQEWWRQVLDARADHPWIRAVSWLELERVEAEVDDRPVDWRATHLDALAEALRGDLRDAGVWLDEPVTREIDQDTANEATAQGRIPGPEDLPDSMGWVVAGVVSLAGLLLLSGLVGRLRPRWRYQDDSPATSSRDLRVDLFRGFLICTVVVTHTEVGGPFSWFTLNAFGAISGAEAFVALSGVVVGMVHRVQAERLGDWAASVLRWQRARKLYVTALVVTLLVWLLDKVPGLDATVVTTFTDRGTGEGGSSAAGQVYDLYVNAPRLLDYPPPWYAVRDLLLLHMGPWVLNVLGLFVVLIAVSPVLLWLLRRRLWWLVLALSWAAYAAGTRGEVRLLPSQFEDVFPLLIWQVVFVHGMVVGYHRRVLARALTSRPGKAAVGALVVSYAAALGWLWLAHAGHLPAGPWPEDVYARLYDDYYVRVFLQAGRLLDLAVVVVVAYAVLTTCWRPINAATGRLLVPLGQASLYVFVMHVLFVIAVDNVPGLDHGSAWQGAAVHVVEIALAWVLVKQRVLFSVVPR